MAAWLFWIGGGVLAAGGVALLMWAILGDRLSRQRPRRRCPKCWYDMSGVPGLVCPECGREARDERRLGRSRRRWKWAAVAVLIMLAGTAGVLTPRVQSRGWETLLPTTVVIWMLPWYADPPLWYSNLLFERTSRRDTPLWQRKLLFRRCDGVLRSTASSSQKLRTLRIIESVAWRGPYPGRPTANAVAATPVLLRAMMDDEPDVRGYAAAILPTVCNDPEMAVGPLTALLESDPSGTVRHQVVGALGRFREAAAPAAAAAIACLEFREQGTPTVRGQVLHRDVLGLMGAMGAPAAEFSVPVLATALQRPDLGERVAAVNSLRRLGSAAGPAAEALTAALGDPEPQLRARVLDALADIGAASDQVIAAVFLALDDEDILVRDRAITALVKFAPDDERMLRRLHDWIAARADAARCVEVMGLAGGDIRPLAHFLVPQLRVPGPNAWGNHGSAARLLCICGYEGLDGLGGAEFVRRNEIGGVRVWGELLAAQIQGDRLDAVPGIIQIIQNTVPEDSNTRGDAAEALALIGPGADAALPLLEGMLKEEAWLPRENAKRAIHAITGEPLEGRLEPMRTSR